MLLCIILNYQRHWEKPLRLAHLDEKRTLTVAEVRRKRHVDGQDNNYGSVSIENKQGNITIDSVTVDGKSVTLIATKGSVSQDYTDGIVNVGGNPFSLNSDKGKEMLDGSGLDTTADSDTKVVTTDTVIGTDSDSGRIAGDSVYISANDINVNGLIQSGYARYVAEIPEYVQNEDGTDYTDNEGNKVKTLSDKHIQMLKNNGSEVTVSGRTMYKVNDGNKAVYEDSTDVYKYVAPSLPLEGKVPPRGG